MEKSQRYEDKMDAMRKEKECFPHDNQAANPLEVLEVLLTYCGREASFITIYTKWANGLKVLYITCGKREIIYFVYLFI